MGNCASPPANRRRISQQSTTVKVIHVDGMLQEFDQPIKAGHVTAQNPSCFLCSSESMHLGSHLPRVGEDEELQLGQIYFLMSHENSQNALSLPQLCELAVKVSAALSKHAGLLSKNASCSRRAWSQIPGRLAVMEDSVRSRHREAEAVFWEPKVGHPANWENSPLAFRHGKRPIINLRRGA